MQNMRYEVKKVWRYGSRRRVVSLPRDWAGIQYVLIRRDEEGIIIYPLEGINTDAEAAELAIRLNRRLEANNE